MKFDKHFQTMKDVNKYFCPDSNYIFKPVNKVFGDRQAICNDTITKLNFYNIIATAIEYAKSVNNRKEASNVFDVIKDVVLEARYDIDTFEIAIQGDELAYLFAAINFELCRIKPEYTDIWSRFRNLCLNGNQRIYFDSFVKSAEDSFQTYQSLNRKEKCL